MVEVRTQTFRVMNLTFMLIMLYAPIVYGQTYSTMIVDSEIVNVINLRVATLADERNLKSLKVNSQINSWSANPFLTNELDSIFTKADFDFVKEQMRNLIKDNRWKRKGLKKVKLFKNIPSKSGDEYAQYAFSQPLFSIDKTRLIIREFYLCAYHCTKISIKLFEKGIEVELNYKATLIED